jgi:hypothetical protein
MQTQTLEQKTEEGPTVAISLKSLARMERQVGQWITLVEHYAQYGLDKKQQLEYANEYCKAIRAEIEAAKKDSPYNSQV